MQQDGPTHPPPVSSRIAAVTLYREGALVTREATVTRTNGSFPRQVRLTNLPLSLEDSSVRVRVEADGLPPVAADMRVALEVPERDESLPPAEAEDLLEARRREESLREHIEQLEQSKRLLETLEISARPEGKKGTPPAPPPTAARLELLSFRNERLQDLLRGRQAVEKEHRAAKEHRQHLEAQRKRASSARQVREHELRKAVLVRLDSEGSTAVKATVFLDYLVHAARWAPAYTIRFNREVTQGELSLRALVCQASGEDWNGVSLTLSTAHAKSWTELPQLPSLRIGRRQPPCVQAGWRDPPEGAEALYEDFDRAVPRRGQAEIPEETDLSIDAALLEEAPEAAGEEECAALELMGGELADLGPPAEASAPAGAAPPPVAVAAAAVPRSTGRASRRKASPRGLKKRKAMARGQAPPSAPCILSEPPAAGLAPADSLLDYRNLHMPPPDDPARGKLSPVPVERTYMELLASLRISVALDLRVVLSRTAEQTREVQQKKLPEHYSTPKASDGYDYAYVAEGKADIASDAEFHSVPVLSHQAQSDLRFVTVPIKAQDVFRFVQLPNPLDAPLLDGPADIHVGGDFLMTTPLRQVAPHGKIRLGLGVEEGIKVARNTSYEETSAGIMSGYVDLKHRIRIQVVHHLPRTVKLEVRERVPVAHEDHDLMEVTVTGVAPEWQRFQQEEKPVEGGYCWKIALKPGEPRNLKADYVIQIPAKNEIVGGNRRER